MDEQPVILIVDDEPFLRKSLSDILRTKGYQPLAASQGKTALEEIQRTPPVVALIDLKLEDMSGLEVMRGIKTLYPETECIVITGNATQSSAIEAVNLGAYSYILKPYDPEQVLEIIRRAVEKQATQATLKEREHDLAEAQRLAHIGSWRYDLADSNLVFSNEMFRMLGLEPDSRSLPYAEYWKYIYPEDQERLTTTLQAAIDTGAAFQFDLRIVRPDGVMRHVDVLGETERSSDGSITKLSGTAQDITERKQAEQALRQRLLELETIYKITNVLHTFQSVDEMLPTLLDETLSALNFKDGAIYLTNTMEKGMRLISARGWLKNISFTPGKTHDQVRHTMFATGKPYLVRELSTAENLQSYFQIEAPPGWGGVFIPLHTLQEILGMVFVSNPLPREFTSGELQILSIIAEMTSIAIHRIRLLEQLARRVEELRQRNEELDRLGRASNFLTASSSVGLKDLAETISNTVLVEFKQASCSLYLIQKDSRELKWIATAGSPSEPSNCEGELRGSRSPSGIHHPQKLSPTSRISQAILAGQIMRSPAAPAGGSAERIDSEMAFPLKIGEEIIGAIQIHQGRPGALSAEDERLMLIFAERAALALERTRLLEQITQHLRRLTVLHTVDLAITTGNDLRVTLAVLLDQVMPELEADGAAIILYHPEERLLRFTASRGMGGGLNSRQQFQLSECLAGQVILNNRMLLVPDLQNYAQELQDSQDHNGDETTLRQDILQIQSQGFNAYFGMLLVAEGQVKGVFEVFRRTPFHPDAEWLNFMQTASESAAIAIDNATLFNNLQKSNLDLAQAYDATLEGWSRALDLRDGTTNDHTQRVTEMTLNLARLMGINKADLIHVRRGALLHDIGKMGVPDRILLKPGPLTDEEWQIMRMHPDFAYQLLKPVEYLRPALDIPYCHHEKWDGSGYPRGLKGEQIPLVARIFAVIDVWDALCSDRPYRPAWTPERTRDYILSQSGIHFDPQVVEAFIQMI